MTNYIFMLYVAHTYGKNGSDVKGHRLLNWFFFLIEGLFLHNKTCNYWIEYFCHILVLNEGSRLKLENMQHFKQCHSYDYNHTKLTNAAVFFRSLSKEQYRYICRKQSSDV